VKLKIEQKKIKKTKWFKKI